jgi:hypothetical protein
MCEDGSKRDVEVLVVGHPRYADNQGGCIKIKFYDASSFLLQ